MLSIGKKIRSAAYKMIRMLSHIKRFLDLLSAVATQVINI
jgi:hypothetical protein